MSARRESTQHSERPSDGASAPTATDRFISIEAALRDVDEALDLQCKRIEVLQAELDHLAGHIAPQASKPHTLANGTLSARLDRIKRLTHELARAQADSGAARHLADCITEEVDATRAALQVLETRRPA